MSRRKSRQLDKSKITKCRNAEAEPVWVDLVILSWERKKEHQVDRYQEPGMTGEKQIAEVNLSAEAGCVSVCEQVVTEVVEETQEIQENEID